MMMKTEGTGRDLLDVCVTCGQTWEWHIKYQPEHAFNDGSLPPSATFARRRADGSRGTTPAAHGGSEPVVRAVRYPFDPVLRQALVNKGILTPQDLRDAEEMIRITTGEVLSGQQRGRQEGLRGEVTPERVQGVASPGEVQDDSGQDRQRGNVPRETVSDGQEGSSNPETQEVTRCNQAWLHGNPFRYCACGWRES